MRYERRGERPLTGKAFAWRLSIHLAVGGLVILGSLAVGMAGYAYFEGLAWLDAFLNASMILSGMGPVDRMDTAIGKTFAALYALFSGVVFIGVMGIVLAPWVHRLVHWTHLDDR